MPTYAYQCRLCGERLYIDPKFGPVLDDFHRLVHGLEKHLDGGVRGPEAHEFPGFRPASELLAGAPISANAGTSVPELTREELLRMVETLRESLTFIRYYSPRLRDAKEEATRALTGKGRLPDEGDGEEGLRVMEFLVDEPFISVFPPRSHRAERQVSEISRRFP